MSLRSSKLAGFAFAHALAALSLFVPSGDSAAASKDECVDAHGKGQDLREKGQLVRARQMFMACAQSSCPNLIQGDCARFGDELERIVPTVTFGARDSKAADIPNTSVYVDEVLVATRLDDGKSYELDPGKHMIRYVHDGKETTLKVILSQGEKGRVLVATFVDPRSSSSPASAIFNTETTPPPAPKKPMLPLVVAGVGAAALAAGGALFAVEMGKVPSNCSVGTKECAAPPNDPSFQDAHAATSMANVGLGVGIAGAVLLVTGIIWYVASPATTSTPSDSQPPTLQSWAGRNQGGFSLKF
jgi:hypothetical protein